jgi:CRISPR-associated protein Csx10
MDTYLIKLTFKSDALPGSGEGFGSVIDQDVVFDELGIPYIPAKRIKGLLRESYEEVCQVLRDSGSAFCVEPASLFGEPGQQSESPVYFSNLFVENYKNIKNMLKKLSLIYPLIFNQESIIEAFTYLRQQTAIDQITGTALPHSLRTIRVLKKGITFVGDLKIDKDILGKNINNNYINLIYCLALACKNLKRMGTKRTRGFGELDCFLADSSGKDLTEGAITWLNGGCK